MRESKFKIGQQYKTIGKHSKVCTIVDIHKTFNSNGDLVKLRYVSEHEFCGQVVKDNDVLETTIRRGLL